MFHPDSFGDLTVDTVLQAIKYGQRFRRQDAHMDELGIATLTSCFINANRDPKKGKPAKASDFFYFAGDDTLDPAIANAFFSLIPDKLLPSWVVHASPIDLLKRSKTNGSHPRRRRVLLGDGVAIFAPEVTVDAIYSDFAVFNSADWGWTWIEDVDTKDRFEVFVEPPEYDQQYSRDLTLERRKEDG